jgi:hypothetical protein
MPQLLYLVAAAPKKVHKYWLLYLVAAAPKKVQTFGGNGLKPFDPT